MKFLNTIWQDIRQGENIDSYIAIIVALGLSVANIFGLASQPLLASITLAVLALLAITNLGNRHRLDMALNQKNGDHFMKAFPESVRDDMDNAKELWLVGYSLTRTVVTYSTLIDEKLERGEKIKVLLIDPHGTAFIHANKSLYYPMSDEQHRERIKITLSSLIQISKGNKSGLEIRLVDFPFAAGMYISLFAFDVFESGLGFWGTLLALFMHLLPSILLALAIYIAWKREWVGAALFLGWAIWYVVFFRDRNFPWGTYAIIAGIPAVIGLFFVILVIMQALEAKTHP